MKYRVGDTFRNVENGNIITIYGILDNFYHASWISEDDNVKAVGEYHEAGWNENIRNNIIEPYIVINPNQFDEDLFTL